MFCKLEFQAIVFQGGVTYICAHPVFFDCFSELMFKIFLSLDSRSRMRFLLKPEVGLRLLAVCVTLGTASGCHTLPRFAPVNLKDPGWTVREGQALWRRDRSSPEIAGDFIVATRADGQSFVQFTKTPFPFVIGQTLPGKWQIEMPVQNKRYSGRGKAPRRFIWFYLPLLLAGSPPPRDWSWHMDETKHWRLENQSTGDSLEGYFSQ